MKADIVNALLWKDGKILLARRSRQRRFYPGKWSFPGGHAEPGETLEAALKRELIEELGVIPSRLSPFASFNDPNRLSVRYHLFLVTEWTGGEPNIRDHEHSELAWLSPSEGLDLSGLALEIYRRIFRRLEDPGQSMRL